MIETISNYFINNSWESIGAIAGVISIYLNTRENPWGWPIGLLSVFCYLYVFWEVFLFGDVLLHLVYLIMGFYGWYQWVFGVSNSNGDNQKLEVKRGSTKKNLILLLIGAISTLIMGFLFSEFTENTLPYADAFTTAFSLVGTYMLARKYIENWLLWMIVNSACIIIYYIKGLEITTVLYCIYLILAFVGYFNWKKNLNSNYSETLL